MSFNPRVFVPLIGGRLYPGIKLARLLEPYWWIHDSNGCKVITWIGSNIVLWPSNESCKGYVIYQFFCGPLMIYFGWIPNDTDN